MRRPELPSLVVALVAGLAAAPPARGCETCTPAHVVPAARWDTLQPWQGCVAAGGADCSILGDTTFYRFNYEPRCGIPAITYPPFWFDLDAEGSVLFAATGSTLQIWNLSGALADPVADVCEPVLGQWLKTDQDHYVTSVDAPPGRSDVVVVGIEGGMGVSIFDTTNPADPVLKFQDEAAGTVWTVQATRINGQDYAIAVTDSQDVLLYNLQAALNLTTPCYEETVPRACGVFMLRLQAGGTPLRAIRKVAAIDSFIAISVAGRPVVWDLAPLFAAQPGDPRLVYSHPAQVPAFEIWRQGAQLILAVGTGQVVQVYDLPCVASGTCAAATPLATLATPGAPVGQVTTSTDTLEFSRDGNLAYLFAGSTTRRGGGPQREYLFDITNAASPEELTPRIHPEGYWGWYYEDNPTGFHSISPYTGVVNNGRLYRSGWSLLDVHEIQGSLPPVPSFQAPPLPIYVGDSVTFTDTSSRTPTSWKWWFDYLNQSGNPDSTVRNPAWTFQAARAYRVRLEACNDAGCAATFQDLTITSAVPVIGGVAANVSTIPQCGSVTFSSSGVVGRPPLAYDWDVIDSQDAPTGASATTASFVWQVPQSQTPGAYRGRLLVSNTAGDATRDTAVVNVTTLPPLTTPQVSADPPNLGEVAFHSTGQGATEWRWEWGDGTPDFVTTDPVLGADPVHTYTSTGTYRVDLTVSNCRDGIKEATTTVTVTEVQQLVLSTFQVQGVPECNPTLGCRVNANVPYSFRVVASGSPTTFDFDWNGDGAFEEANVAAPAPVNGIVTLNHPHTFTQSGVSVTPKVKARRGTQNVERAHIQIQVGTPVVPSVSVIGPSTLQVGQSGTFTATASNCTPAPTTWNWDAAGGTISGSPTAASISVSWASAGAKTVRAQPSDGGCTSTIGQRGVTVSATTGGGTTLGANFVVTTATPTAGQPVAFNASSSTGNPTGFLWQFGDGSQSSGTSPTITHTYAQAGTYTVTLEVSKTDPGCAQGFCVASKSSTITVATNVPPDGSCVAAPETMCLRNGRFEVKVKWKNTTGAEGNGKVAAPTTGDSGLFYFFNPNNWEMLIKVLDGCGINNAFWVFAASSTDLGLTVTVRDTKSDTTKTYTSPAGQSAPAITDTSALAVCQAQ